MKAYLVFPFYDPNVIMWKRLKQKLPILRNNFTQAFVSVTPITLNQQGENVRNMENDDFFIVNHNKVGTQVGEHHLSGCKSALKSTSDNNVLHICTLDRLLFGLYNHQDTMLKDIHNAEKRTLPTVFMRSKKAWKSHPKNYEAIESCLTSLGKVLFEKELDFAWCHITVQNKYLKEIVPKIKSRDMTFFPEVAVRLKDKLTTKKVDWLSWEDPFIFGENATKLKRTLENSPEEDAKRLSYVTSGMRLLLESWRGELS